MLDDNLDCWVFTGSYNAADSWVIILTVACSLLDIMQPNYEQWMFIGNENERDIMGVPCSVYINIQVCP